MGNVKNVVLNLDRWIQYNQQINTIRSSENGAYIGYRIHRKHRRCNIISYYFLQILQILLPIPEIGLALLSLNNYYAHDQVMHYF